MKQPIKNNSGWMRDSTSGSFEFSDTTEYSEYMKKYNSRRKQAESHKALQDDVSALKSEMSEIKTLLLTLVQKNHDN